MVCLQNVLVSQNNDFFVRSDFKRLLILWWYVYPSEYIKQDLWNVVRFLCIIYFIQDELWTLSRFLWLLFWLHYANKFFFFCFFLSYNYNHNKTYWIWPDQSKYGECLSSLKSTKLKLEWVKEISNKDVQLFQIRTINLCICMRLLHQLYYKQYQI